MNLERYAHSSCTIGKTLYVLSGLDEDDEVTGTIEKLTNIDEQVAITSSRWRWQLIELIESFLPRSAPVFCAWNNHEIIILGGKNEEGERLGDGWVFDTRTDTLR